MHAKDAGCEQAAILLLVLGEDVAKQVYPHLSPKQIKALTQSIAGINIVPRARIEAVLDSFEADYAASSLHVNSSQFLNQVVRESLDADKANALLNSQGQHQDGLAVLHWMDGTAIADLLRNEHPQIIAAVLAHLEADQAAQVLDNLEELVRHDVLYRLATLDGIRPEAFTELNHMIGNLVKGTGQTNQLQSGGAQTVANVLNHMRGSYESRALDALRLRDADLAQHIADTMFSFENLVDMDDRSVQILLREIPTETLLIALKGASEHLKNKIFRNMSARAAEMMKEEIDIQGPVRVSMVESNQREILNMLRRMIEEGLIDFRSTARESYVN